MADSLYSQQESAIRIIELYDASPKPDTECFTFFLDVSQFEPGDLVVKLTLDNMIVIEGQHEEREDHHGLITRHFIRRYPLPDTCDRTKLTCLLSNDGVMKISAPPKNAEIQKVYEVVPIYKTSELFKNLKPRRISGMKFGMKVEAE